MKQSIAEQNAEIERRNKARKEADLRRAKKTIRQLKAADLTDQVYGGGGKEPQA